MGVAVLRQGGAVIDLRVAVGSDGHVLLRHFQRAVDIAELVARSHIGAVRIHDLRRGWDIIGSADHSLRAGHGDGVDAVAGSQIRIGVAVLRQCCTVIGFTVAVGGDGHSHLRHFQRAVGIADLIAGSHVITISIHDHCRGRDIIGSADNSLRTGDGDGVDAVAGGQITVGVAVLRQRCTVIDFIVTVSGDGQFFLHHFQRAVGIGDLIAGGHIVTGCVHDLCRRRDIIGSADYSLRTGDSDGVNLVTRCQIGVGVAVLCQGSAVVNLFITFCGDGQSQLCHFQRAIGVGDIVARGHIFTGCVHDLRRGRNIVHSTENGLGTGHGDGFKAVPFSQTGAAIAVHGQGSAVISPRITVSGDGQTHLFHFQTAVGVGDGVTGGHILAVSIDDLRFGRDVFGRSDNGLQTGHGDGRKAVTFRESRIGVAVLRQSRTVIGLCVTGGSDGHRLCCHFQ